jgi:hypothetical protein
MLLTSAAAAPTRLPTGCRKAAAKALICLRNSTRRPSRLRGFPDNRYLDNMKISEQSTSTHRSLLIGLLTLTMFALSGSAAYGAATLSVEPTSWDFGSRDPGSGPSEPKIFKWTNTGEVGLSFFSESIGSFNTDPNLFSFFEQTCNVELAPGQSCFTAVTFNPSSPGRKHGVLQLYPHVPAPPEPVYAEAQLWGTGTGVEVNPPLPQGPPIPAPGRVALIGHPQHRTTSRNAVFSFQTFPGIRYVCRIDHRRQHQCQTPMHFNGLTMGHHHLAIHAVNVDHVDGPVKNFDWFIRTRR